ncbi:MAG: dihydropteroate synthase [Acidobacteriota bacterium]
MYWQTSRRQISLDRPLVMAILNVTPDSFSDGGKVASIDDALRQAEKFVADGADIIDIGGESTRPGSLRVPVDEEILRVVPVIEAIAKRLDVAISVDTSKSDVAERAIDAGAEIINDISGLRFDEKIGEVAAKYKTGLILMHSRGDFETLHSQPAVSDILQEVSDGFHKAIALARHCGVSDQNMALDVGIGFGKTQEQNLELLAKLDKLTAEFSNHPVLVGTSRKSFIGKLMNDAPVNERLGGSLATAAIAVWNGVKIVRVHDVKETAEILQVIVSVRDQL